MKNLVEGKTKVIMDSAQRFPVQKADTGLIMETPNPRMVNLHNADSVGFLHCHGLLIPLFPLLSDNFCNYPVLVIPYSINILSIWRERQLTLSFQVTGSRNKTIYVTA